MRVFHRDGLDFDVVDTGPRQGPTVVCLHGFPQDATAFGEVGDRLAQQGVRVLAPHQRGYSPGARPTEAGAYAMGELVGDVLALLDAADVDAAHVVGHDWGGAVAWTMAGRHAARVRSVTVLSTPHPAAMRDGMRSSSQGLRSAYMGFFQLPRLPEALLLAADARPLRTLLTRTGLPAADADRYVARMRAPGALGGGLAWYRALRSSRGQGAGRVRVPTKYLWGRHDPFFAPACARMTGRYVTDLTTREVDGGHWLPETRPDVVADAVLEQIGTSER